jgi:uncharacterized membrane protein
MRPLYTDPSGQVGVPSTGADQTGTRRHLPAVALTRIEQVRRLARHLPVAVLIVAYAVRFALLSVQVQDGYGTPGFDMGIFDQGVWLLSTFHAPFVTVMGRNLFGDHTSFILLLAVPLYWIWPHPQTLLVLQACLIAAAAIPVYLLALRRSADAVVATALAAAFLLNPALQNGNLEQFHPEAFLVLAIALALYAAVFWKPRLLVAGVVLSLLVKEDTAVLIVPLGIWVLIRRNRRWGAGIIAAAVAYMAFAYYVVIDSLLGTVSFYANRIPFGGIDGLVSTPFAHPVEFWRYTRSGGRLFYMWQMTIAFGFGFIWAPELAAIVVLSLAENVFSDFPYMHQILYHYSLPLVSVLAMGTAFAVTSLRTEFKRYAAAMLVVACAATTCYLWGLAPWSKHTYPHWAPNSPQVAATTAVLKEVPPNAVISAYYAYVPHLDHRTRIYQWPTPFRATYWGLYTQEGQRLPFANQVEYVVLPTSLSPSDEQVLSEISHQYRLIDRDSQAMIYERDGPADPIGQTARR